MYSLKVRGKVEKDTAVSDQRSAKRNDSGGPSTAGTTPVTSRPTSPRAPGNNTSLEEIERVGFSAGNPRVEHITGIVHLYRHIPEADAAIPAAFESEHNSNSGDVGGAIPLPTERSEQLCVLSLPPDMHFPEFCTFLGAYFDRVREVRLVRREGAGASTCLVLVRFDDQDAADGFHQDFNGKPFCILEPEFVCCLLFVKEVDISEEGRPSPSSTKRLDSPQHPTPPAGATELPSCPVCLERLDEHVSGVVTTVCNHRFHNQCLRQWGDSSCPVCRYCQHPAEGSSHCSACGASADIWICLICGHVGCGRYRGSHAADHWQESGHGYALELETQRVWDYASDAYVHRLVRSKTDGKLVEVPAPGARGTACGGGTAEGGSSEGMMMDPEMEEAMVLSKFDALAGEYNHLLVTQLESQRQYFEGMLVKQQHDLEAALLQANAKASIAAEAAGSADAAATEAERRRCQLDSKLADTKGRLEKALEEKDFLKQLNDTLLANQKSFAEKLKEAEGRATEQNALIVDLQEQLRDLMVFIEARQTIEGEGGGEVEGATLLPLPPQAGGRRGRRKK